MSNFLQKLKQYRSKTGLSRDDAGKSLGVSGRYIGIIEREEKVVDEDSPVALLLDLRLKELNRNSVSLPEDEMPETPTQWEFSHVVNEDAMTGGRGKLKELRRKAGYADKDRGKFARLVGYSPLVYANIEDGTSNMSRKMAVKVAQALGCTVEELLDGSDHPPSKGLIFGTVGETPDIELGPGQKGRYVPLISMARCGALEHGDMVAFDDGAYEHEGFLVINPADSKTFAVTLAGDSMMPAFAPGDVAVIYPSKPPRNGGIVLAKLNGEHGDGVMIKLYQQAGNQVVLSSYNAAYPPVTCQRSDFVWIYPVAMVTKVFPS